MTRVFIASRVRLFGEGLAGILAREPQVDVIGMAGAASETRVRCHALEPDVLLIDLTIEGGLDVARELAASDKMAVIVVGGPETEVELFACAEAGIAGFVSRDDSLGELLAAMQSVALGDFLCSPSVAGSLLRHVKTLAAGRPRDSSEVRLTTRELEVARLIDEGLSNKQIALELRIELPTVKHHVHHILEKLGVARRSEAVTRLRRQGLLRSTSAM
jgi:two-component system nitrate/nitrite response regulator NarL